MGRYVLQRLLRAVFHRPQMLHRLPRRRAGLRGRVQARARIYFITHIGHPLAMVDGRLKMRFGFLAMLAGRRQYFENGFGVEKLFQRILKQSLDCFGWKGRYGKGKTLLTQSLEFNAWFSSPARFAKVVHHLLQAIS